MNKLPTIDTSELVTVTGGFINPCLARQMQRHSAGEKMTRRDWMICSAQASNPNIKYLGLPRAE